MQTYKVSKFLRRITGIMLIAILLIVGCKANVTTALSVVRFTVTASAGANGSITANPLIPSDGKVQKILKLRLRQLLTQGTTLIHGQLPAGCYSREDKQEIQVQK